MTELVIVSCIFLTIAQAIGLIAYYSKRNQYSKSAQNLATILPAIVFVILVVLGGSIYLLLNWWVDEEGLRERLTTGQPLVMWAGAYVVAGAILNIFCSILVQLAILLIHPPKYKPRRRRSRSESSKSSV